MTDSFVVTHLRDIYHELGEFEFKVAFDTEKFGQESKPTIQTIDSSGKPMKSYAKIWGSKLKCYFVIDSSVSDGIAFSKFSLMSKSGEVFEKTVTFWVVK